MPHPGQVVPLEAVELRHQAVLGRRLAEDGRARLADQAEPLLRVEAARVEHGRRALAPWPEQDVPDRLRPAGAGRAPDDVVGPRVEPALRLRTLGPRVPVGLHDALRVLGRAGGVEDQCRVLGARVGGAGVRLAELGVADVDHVGLLGHRLDLGPAARVGDEQRCARVPGAEVEIPGPQHLRAGDRDRARLQGREHQRMPVRRLPDEDQHTVAGLDPAPQ